jgi:hypothetical protein
MLQGKRTDKQEHAQSFTQTVVEDWTHDDKFSLVQINHQRNPLKSMLLNFFVSSLKRTVPEKWWKTYLVVGGEWSEFDVSPRTRRERWNLAHVVDQSPSWYREQDIGLCIFGGSELEDQMGRECNGNGARV